MINFMLENVERYTGNKLSQSHYRIRHSSIFFKCQISNLLQTSNFEVFLLLLLLLLLLLFLLLFLLLLILLPGALVMLFVAFSLLRRRQQKDPLLQALARLDSSLIPFDRQRRQGETVGHFFARLRREFPPLAGEFDTLADYYERISYAGDANPALQQQFQRIVARCCRLLVKN